MKNANLNPDLYLIGYGKRRNDSLPRFRADQVIGLNPDELSKPYGFLTQQEREFYENTPYGSSILLAPHVNIHDQTPRHRRIEDLHRRLKCTWEQAGRIRDAFGVIEADAKVIDRFIQRSLQRPEKLEADIRYIENLAGELKEIEPDEEFPVDPEYIHQTTSDYSRVASRGAESLFHHCDVLVAREYGIEAGEEPDDAWMDIQESGSETLSDWDVQEKAEADHSILAGAEMIGYHPVEKAETDWLESQPLTFQFLIQKVRTIKTYSELSELAKHVHANSPEEYAKVASNAGLGIREVKALFALVYGDVRPFNMNDEPNGALRYRFRINREGQARVMNFWLEHIPPLTSQQRAVFWTFRDIQRKKMNMQPATLATVQPQGQKLLKKIIETKSAKQLKWLGAQMMNFQMHRIPGSRLRVPEWNVVWGAYQERKEDFKQQAA